MNMMKTFILLTGLTALFGAVGHLIGGREGMIMALVMAGAGNLFAYWNSDKMVLKMYGAQPVQSGPFVEMIRDLAMKAGLPMPKVYVIDSDQPNAFATGRNPQNAAVAATRGILNALSEDELRGVMAHELAHIKNRDTLTMTVTATLAGALSALANFAMMFGGAARRERGAGPLASIALVVLAPLAAMLVQMAISRTREYAADRGGAQIAGDPMALARALQKIEAIARGTPNVVAERNPGTAHLFIINPLWRRGMDNLFATHPSTANRVEALSAMAGHVERLDMDSKGALRNPWG